MRSISLFAASLALAAPAAAQTLDVSNINAVAAVVQDLGLPAAASTTESGRPLIRSRWEGVNFSIVFYNCEADWTGCRNMHMRAGFGTEGDYGPIDMNRWNDDRVVGQAAVDAEGSVRVSHYVVTDGDIDARDFAATLGLWTRVLEEFTVFIDWN
ncbi:MAG: YbjN domain-containing protein [Pseudomonadota bacterium]